ncbi:oxidoreductase [Tolypocladium capitatum]|uniref:Oxidoreductase n=1 Tax=Tolypocladium capitatum TaxID=45235 RepID=A0A2K3QNL5_9HYPO|nr:oxidoreductase [Tolypocladium capitatum]
MAGRLLNPSSAQNSRDKHDDAEYAPGAMSPVTALSTSRDRSRGPRKLILCFDGTGNKFHGDESDSNILKIFRMLDRTAGDQYHYYQPGIGTYVVSGSLDHTGVWARIKSWYQKAKDSAVGSSFDQHVVGGYRFLMRFYNPGDEIYMFGFSRGAYIARFLAEMLDHIGLLSHGNEEMVKFAWKAFAQWQSRRQTTNSEGGEEPKEDEKAHKMHDFMKAFRETFSRPVGRIRFLGLFDTVNSVPRFETAWMQRSKFPYTARSSAKVIRHAVSIDERRAKFRQDLMYQSHPNRKHHRHPHMEQLLEPFRRSMEVIRPSSIYRPQTPPTEDRPAADKPATEKERRPSNLLLPGEDFNVRQRRPSTSNSRYAPYRPRPRSRQRCEQEDADAMSCVSGMPSDDDVDWDDGRKDIDEVWFAGGHGDIGGGWEALDDRKSASHVPLAWIVREAIKAGLPFDMEKVAQMGCLSETSTEFGKFAQGAARLRAPDILVQDETNGVQAGPVRPEINGEDYGVNGSACGFHDLMHRAHTSRIHDSLEYGGGLGMSAVTAWNFMEWFPFRRMDLQTDGSWKPIRWPLPRGEVRDIPSNARVHGSVIRRLKDDETYRPGNLIIGGGGRGVRRAPPQYGIGDWVCVGEHGDPIGEVWMRKEKAQEINGHMPIPFIFYLIEHGPPDWLRDNRWIIFYTSLTVTILYTLKRWTSGRSNTSERPLHGKVVLFTGGTSGVGAQAAQELAARGAQLVLLTRTPPSDPFLVEYIQDIRDKTGNNLVYAEQVDLASLHSIRKFATKWIDNAPPRRLDMIVLCAATLTPPGGKRKETEEGLEETWMVNFLANFHLLGILSPAIKAQPFDRDVRIVMATCSSYIGSPSLKEAIKDHNWSPGQAYARSKLALNVFGQAFQKHLDSYKRPDELPMNARVIFVDPGFSRTPGTRRWLTRGSLSGLSLYLAAYAVPWFLLKSPFQAAQSILYAAMELDLGRGAGGKLIKECMEVDFARAEINDDDVAKKLWEDSDALIERVEKAQAKKRAAQKAEQDRWEKEQEEEKRLEEVEELVNTIKKGKERQRQEKSKGGAKSTGKGKKNNP